MIVAQMSRDSIQQSADYGISAEQILNYLRSSAHPVARKNKHWVPQVRISPNFLPLFFFLRLCQITSISGAKSAIDCSSVTGSFITSFWTRKRLKCWRVMHKISGRWFGRTTNEGLWWSRRGRTSKSRDTTNRSKTGWCNSLSLSLFLYNFNMSCDNVSIFPLPCLILQRRSSLPLSTKCVICRLTRPRREFAISNTYDTFFNSGCDIFRMAKGLDKIKCSIKCKKERNFI